MLRIQTWEWGYVETGNNVFLPQEVSVGLPLGTQAGVEIASTVFHYWYRNGCGYIPGGRQSYTCERNLRSLQQWHCAKTFVKSSFVAEREIHSRPKVFGLTTSNSEIGTFGNLYGRWMVHKTLKLSFAVYSQNTDLWMDSRKYDAFVFRIWWCLKHGTKVATAKTDFKDVTVSKW